VPPCLRERPLRERLLKRVSRTTHARGVSDFVLASAPPRLCRKIRVPAARPRKGRIARTDQLIV
jgi:hypothetical protein